MPAKEKKVEPLTGLDKPTVWPNVNARLLGLGVGLPVNPLDRLALFSADEFERFTLEWADGFLKDQLPDVVDIQQRGGAGDKGRDIIVWFDAPGSPSRKWHLYQCKRYSNALGAGKGIAEIAKILFYSFRGDFSLPSEYWFVTRKGVTGDFQDLIDNPSNLKQYIIDNWDTHCAKNIMSEKVDLDDALLSYIESIDFKFISVKQPQDLITEHSKTKYHLTVFGAPLINRSPPLKPPSEVDESECGYIEQLFMVIKELIGMDIKKESDFSAHHKAKSLYERSRLTFYSAEGLKELARDQMNNADYFDQLLGEFNDGLYYTYSGRYDTGYTRLTSTVKAAQVQQVSGHVLEPHLTAADREGICHQLANNGDIKWCKDE